ncbi:MAG: hypothetical protein MJ236_04495 [Clostridia bacterium]|nr:hypothetical protein [Clostridia bacterium]
MKSKVELIKTIIVGILMISMVCLTLLYLNLFVSNQNYEFTRDMDAAVRNESYKAAYVSLLNEKLSMPYCIGYKLNGSSGIVLGDGIENAYNLVKDYFAWFCESRVTIEYDSEASFSDFLNGEYFYIKFRSNIPKSLLYYTQSPDKILDKIGDDFIYEAAIVLDTIPYMIARSFNGKVAVYRTTEIATINKNDIRRLSNYAYEGLNFAYEAAYDDVFESSGLRDKIYDYSLVPNKDILLTGAIAEHKYINLKSDLSNILGVFDMNPDKVTSHEDEDEITFFDEGHNLIVGKSGNITYSALSKSYGIDIGKFIGYEFADNEYSYLDYLGTALVMSNKLELTKNNIISLSIGDINTTNEVTTISLYYTFNGITVLTNEKYAISIDVMDGKIVSVKCDMVSSNSLDDSIGYSAYLWNWNVRSDASITDKKTEYKFVYEIKDRRLSLNLISFTEAEGGHNELD